MAINRRDLSGLSPEDVFAVLADGRSYAYWVVGTREIRKVTGGWPEPDAALHYSAGYFALHKKDETRVLESDRPHRLKLEARTWPVGSLHIELRVQPTSSGCTVTIEEHPKKGVLKVLHNPLIDIGIRARNTETLRRLEKRVREQATKPAP